MSSFRKPPTSFTTEAPASTAFLATSAFCVSIEIGMSEILLTNSIAGITRSNSSSALTGLDPGLVDSPPISIISAPSATISFIRF